MSLPVVLAFAVIFIGFPINLLVVVRLVVLYRRTGIAVIRERALAAFVIAVVVALFAYVFVNNSFFDPNNRITAFASMVITRLAILLLALPALYWLWLYRGGSGSDD